MTGPLALRTEAPSAPVGRRGPGRPATGEQRPQLQKARFALYEARPGGSGEDLGSSFDRIEFQFNPKELSVQKSATWRSEPARAAAKAGPPEFTGAGPCRMTLELFFDASTTVDGSVVASVEKLFSCCVPTAQSRGQRKASPPILVLQWGQTRSFPAYVSQVSARYTLFSPAGTPLRATCSVSLEEMPGVVVKQNPTSGSLAARRVHTVVAGDSLASIAHREYGDPAMWRALADYNHVDDPLRVRAGATLLVPRPEELAPAGG